MTGFPLAQITDVLPYPLVPLEPWCALLQAMLYLGLSLYTWSCLSCQTGSEDGGGELLQVSITLQDKGPMTGWHRDEPQSLPRSWAQAEAWLSVSQEMLNSGYLCTWSCLSCPTGSEDGSHSLFFHYLVGFFKTGFDLELTKVR